MRYDDSVLTSRAGALRATLTLGVTADLGVAYHARGRVPWQVALQGDGDLNDLPFSARVSAPLQATFDGHALDLTSHWHLIGHALVTHLALDSWGGSARLGAVHGRLDVRVDDNGIAADGPVTAEALGNALFDAHLAGAYNHARHTLTVARFAATHAASGAHLSAQGTIEGGPEGPRLDLSGDWTHLGWPLNHATLHSNAGTYALSGTWPFAVHVQGDLATAGLPPLSIGIAATLYPDHIRIDTGSASGRGGTPSRASFSGQAQWLPHAQWSAAGTAADIDPASFANLSAGRLAFGFQATGAGFGATDDFSVTVTDLTGVIHELPARGSGQLSRAGTTWRVADLHAQLAGTSLVLDGSIGERADLRFDVHSADLSLLLPELHGHLSGNGEIHGSVANPAVQATVAGGGLSYRQVALTELAARLDADPQRLAASHADVHARGLTLGSRTIDDLRLKLDGAERSHDLDLVFTARDFNVRAHGTGSFEEGAWRGQLRQMTIQGGDALNLALEQPASLAVSGTHVALEELCLRGSPAHLCAGGDWTREGWSLQATAADLPMQTLTAGQSGNLDYRGVIGAALKLSGGNGPVQGSLVARLAGAQLRHRLAGGRIEVTTLGTGNVLVTATPATVAAVLNLDAGNQGSLKGQLTALRNGGEWRALPLSGSVALQTAQLDFIPLYVPEVDRAAGQLAATLDIAGVVGAPLLSGSLSLNGGELDLYQVNLAMREATLKARLQSNRLDFDGAAKFGSGTAAVHGALEWRRGSPHGDFTLSGTQLRVADVPKAQIDASPNLAFHIDGELVRVTGEVRIPRARIAPADLTHAVLASSDEVIVGPATPASASHYQVTSDVTMALGDDVTVEGMGLKARLSGSITEHVASDDQVTHATGEFNVAQGDYTAYGRKLEIERGRLIFSGGPIGDPGIDIRAIKRFDDPTAGATLAGINVRGTLRLPQLSFFSEPPLAQQQIVSLLLAGGGLAGGQTAAGVANTNASRGATNNELLGQGAAIIGQQLGSHIGITDVGVESNIYNETSLVLGRYLSPRLYVSYGLGLTQTLNTVKLRYTLGDHWTVRTEAGQVSGADLVYTLDK